MTRNAVVSASLPAGNEVRRGTGFRKVRLASWNVGSLTRKLIELVKALHRCRINISCVQETK